MINEIFVNIPVRDVKKSTDFFTQLGFKVNEKFSGQEHTCLIATPTISVMLTQADNYTKMTGKPIPPKETTESLISLGCDNKETVTRIVTKALELGAKKLSEPEDQGFMYSWNFEDLDGHLWDLFWMDKNR
jgi:predicted lactoylglutathione lyase